MKILLCKTYLLLLMAMLFSANLFSQTQLTNIPTFYIKTEKNATITSTDIWVNATLTIVSNNPTECIKDSTIKIRGRGNATWNMAKKSYKFKFPISSRILNMPAKDKDWVMLANYADKTLIRNAVAFEIGRRLGMEYTPAVRFADIYLNGEFLGNYTITDQLNVDKNRVNIEKQDTSDVELPKISGGYLMEINGLLDTSDDPFYVNTSKGLNVIVKYPDEEDINAQQFAYITDFVNRFENTLFSSTYANSLTGYRSMVDTTEIVNWYLACELTGNSDSFWSTYWHKKRASDKVIFGPLWDFDIAFNNDDRLGDATQKLMRIYGHNPKDWISQFATDSWFLSKVYKRFVEVKKSGLLEHLQAYIDSIASNLDASQKINFTRWNILNTVVYRELTARGTYQAEIDFLKKYLTNRFAYLENGLKCIEPPALSSSVNSDNYYAIINNTTGKAIDIQNASVTQSAKVVQYTYDNLRPSQQWAFIPTSSSNVYYIQNRNSGLALNNDGQTGSQLTQVSLNNTSQYQRWKVVTINDTYAGIQNMLTNQYSIDNQGGSFNDNNPIILYTNNIFGNVNQQWSFVKLSSISTAVTELQKEADKFMVYPNPAVDYATIFCHWEGLNEAVVSVYTIEGRLGYSSKVLVDNAGSIFHKLSFDKIGMKSGIYIVRISSDNGFGVSTKLFLK